jgi:hypothetical protein
LLLLLKVFDKVALETLADTLLPTTFLLPVIASSSSSQSSPQWRLFLRVYDK